MASNKKDFVVKGGIVVNEATKIGADVDGNIEIKDAANPSAMRKMVLEELIFQDDQGRAKKMSIDNSSGRIKTFNMNLDTEVVTADKIDLGANSTSDLSEGTNLYFTNSRADARVTAGFAAKSTSNLSEGTNKYFTNDRVATYLSDNNYITSSDLSTTLSTYATQSYVTTAVANVIDASPDALNTLNELAAALNDDPNFATTTANSIGAKIAYTTDPGTPGESSYLLSMGKHSSGYQYIQSHSSQPLKLNPSGNRVDIGSSMTVSGAISIDNFGGDRKIQFQRTGGKIISIEHDASQIYFYNVTDAESMLVIGNNKVLAAQASITTPDSLYVDRTSNGNAIVSRTNGVVNFQVENYSTQTTIRTDTADFYIWQPNSSYQLRIQNNGGVHIAYDGSMKLSTRTDGVDVSGSLYVNRANSTAQHTYLMLNKGTGKDGHIIFKDNNVLKWQNVTDGDSLNWYSYAANATVMILNGAGGLTTKGLTVKGGSADWNETIQGSTQGSIHLDPDTNADHHGNAITWGSSDNSSGTKADAGIYVRTDGSYGSKMYFSTTDSYNQGAKTAMDIDHSGNVVIRRGSLTAPTLSTYGSTYKGNFGVASFSWDGSGNYPTIYSDHPDRWVMLCFPHIPFLQGGQRGHTGSTMGSQIKFEGGLGSEENWNIGVWAANTGRFCIGPDDGTNNPISKWYPSGEGMETGRRTTLGIRVASNTWSINETGLSLDFTAEVRSNSASPALGFHWEGVHSRWLYTDSNGHFNFRSPSNENAPSVYVQGTIIEESSIRHKENISTISGSLDKVNSLRGVYYNRIDTPEQEEVGLIAEEVAEVVPELVMFSDDNTAEGVKYSKTVALLVEAIKELTARVEELESGKN